jgi:hypothetical protein
MVLGLLCATIACGERVAVEHLDRASAEALAAELQSAGVAPELRRSGGRWAVVVPASAGPMAERITADLGLARPAAPTRPRLVVGPTEAAADARRHAARDAEALLRARPDVAHAAVSVGAESAAVVVRVRTGSRLTADDVRRLVGHATRLDSQIAVDIHASPSLAAVAGPADGHARRADRARWTVFGLALLMVSAMCLWLVGRLRAARRRPVFDSSA